MFRVLLTMILLALTLIPTLSNAQERRLLRTLDELVDGMSGDTTVQGINAQGHLVIAPSNPDPPLQGFLLQGFAQIALRCAGNQPGTGTGLNRLGAVTGRCFQGTPPPGLPFPLMLQGFVRAPNGQVRMLQAIPGSQFTFPSDISNTGAVAGDVIHPITGRLSGFVWKPNTYQLVDYPGSVATSLTGINSQQNLVGFATLPGLALQGFTRIGGVLARFDVPGAEVTLPLDLTDAGAIVGLFSDANGQNAGSFLFENGVFTRLDITEPGVIQTEVSILTNTGVFGGRYFREGQGNSAFVLPGPWPASGTSPLPAPVSLAARSVRQ